MNVAHIVLVKRIFSVGPTRLQRLGKDGSMKGTVKMFNQEKGFGFITGEDGKDYFFHYSAIAMDSYKTAEKGESVEFEATEGARGLRAEHVQKL